MDSPNFFVLEGRYRYLEAWLDPSVPPQVPSQTAHGQSESLPPAGEFYEIIHSRKCDRQHRELPDINYGGIEKTHVQWQDFFMNGRKGFRNISRGIAAGQRSTELIHSIIMDFRCWMFMRPDSSYLLLPMTVVSFSGYSLSKAPDPFTRLPTETCLYLHPLSSLFALSSASKSLRNMITDLSYLKQVIKGLSSKEVCDGFFLFQTFQGTRGGPWLQLRNGSLKGPSFFKTQASPLLPNIFRRLFSRTLNSSVPVLKMAQI